MSSPLMYFCCRIQTPQRRRRRRRRRLASGKTLLTFLRRFAPKCPKCPLVTFFRKCARESKIAREEENGSRARESRAENVFSSVLVLYFSPYLSHVRALRSAKGEEKANFAGKKKISYFTVGVQPTALATPETPTVIFVSSFISEYVVAPETNCIKAINAKMAVNNFVVNCIVTYVLLLCVARAISLFFMKNEKVKSRYCCVCGVKRAHPNEKIKKYRHQTTFSIDQAARKREKRGKAG